MTGMTDEEDPSQLFAIPDLWRPSIWLNQTFTEPGKGTATPNPLFALDTSTTPTKPLGLGLVASTDLDINLSLPEKPFGADDGDGDGFFKLPSLLRELTSQPDPNQTNIDDQAGDKQAPISTTSVAGDSLCSSDRHNDGDPDGNDFWLFSDSETAGALPQLCTWEAFEQPDQGNSGAPVFLSEAGPAAFDALIASAQAAGGDPDILPTSLYCSCLLNLALGRSSLLFSWDADKLSFVKTSPGLRVSGLSLDLISAVDSLCLDCGNSARHLQAFAEKTYAAAATPTRVALARVVACLIDTVRSELSSRSRQVQSLLQLQAAVQPAQSILSYFKGFVKTLSRQKSDEALLSYLFQEAEASEYRSELIKECTRQVLRILSRPWIELVEEWVGLKPDEAFPLDKKGPGKGFIRVADKMWIDDQGFELEEPDYFLDRDKLPSFISEDMGQTIFETGWNLRFLREHHPEHALSRPDVMARVEPPKLEWEFDWDALSKLEAKANQYREALSQAIRGLTSTSAREKVMPSPIPSKKRKYSVAGLECFGQDEAQVEARLLASINHLNQPLEEPAAQDDLTVLLKEHLYRSSSPHQESAALSPHWTLVPLLSFGPIVSAQSRLVSRECMRLLFTSHHLRTHIDLLRQYFLFSNGLFCSRLAHALFDPDLSSAERQSGVALVGGTMGLRLGGRRTWPPASSELRLALMGVLAECYQPPPFATSSKPARPQTTSNSAVATRAATHHHPADLPGDLSFAVRDLTPEEIDRCMDPDSLEALDFLRLSYRPPAALRGVLDPSTLLRYDRIFRLLLRVLRMLYVADELLVRRPPAPKKKGESNASMRLRLEARHFVKQVAAHFFEVGIEAPWRRFERWLDGVEREISAEEQDLNLGDREGVVGNDDGVGGKTEEIMAAARTSSRPSSSARRQQQQQQSLRSSKRQHQHSDVPTSETTTITPTTVLERHVRALDEIMTVLLLRKRQAPVMALLEEIFGIILRFAKGLRSSTIVTTTTISTNPGRVGKEGQETPEQLYKAFRKKVDAFVTVCKGLGEKMAGSTRLASSLGSEEGGRDGSAVEQLVMRIDMEGFYGRAGGL
ncbi:hypothetical protein VTJ04DRAFT_4550 [Mycothermus thermophilus]|uniref:uncharacterized protein n=1 Tax=Humicola insolens TaxID=85995 RepID=UPI0037440326